MRRIYKSGRVFLPLFGCRRQGFGRGPLSFSGSTRLGASRHQSSTCTGSILRQHATVASPAGPIRLSMLDLGNATVSCSTFLYSPQLADARLDRTRKWCLALQRPVQLDSCVVVLPIQHGVGPCSCFCLSMGKLVCAIKHVCQIVFLSI